ncbi:hypothetical protein [Lentzea sp. NBRC 102530]|uniref:Rv1733c family protein n=1 Tax=Lentzea sp. NBRC 102530 TaxID=3032201 RepID=UPI0024A40502|nr:hypothetical protein [Lentzea sp. NBRC 102530]GLY49862.1 membrane protein [Lentzea sp. NBRC 102530]
MPAKPLIRLARQAFPHRNELATAGDRVEGAVLAFGLAVSLLAVPVAGAVGSEVYATDRTRVAVEQAGRHQVDAFLVEDAPPVIGPGERGGVVETTWARARWRLPDGSAREGAVQARFDAPAGSKVPIWVDENGGVSTAPLTAEGAGINAVILGLLLWAAVTGAMALLHLVTSWTHRRVRARRWAAEWRRVAPEWTGR